MITYTATNTKNGKFYIGSSENYCKYMRRKGQHHTHKKGSNGYSDFHVDLQEDPLSFKWDWHEDGRDDRSTERSMIALYKGNPYLYNIGEGCYERTEKHRGRKNPPEVIKKMRESALKTSAERAENMREVSKRKIPCPSCGKLMNPGNLTQHIRAQTCLKHVG